MGLFFLIEFYFLVKNLFLAQFVRQLCFGFSGDFIAVKYIRISISVLIQETTKILKELWQKVY